MTAAQTAAQSAAQTAAINAWSSTRRILCVRLDALGDVLMTTPALTALKESGSGRHITLLTSSAGAAVAPLLPMVDATIAYDPPWMKATPRRANSGGDLQMIERLRSRHFDAAVIFTVYSQNPLPAAMLCYLADIPKRLAHARENPYQLLTDSIPEPEPQQLVRHETQRQLDLVASVGAKARDTRLSIRVGEAVKARMAERLKSEGLDLEEPWIVVHPGASAPSRRYPAEHFAEAAYELAIEHGCQLVFTGASGERALVDSIREGAEERTWSLAGETTLEELAALLAQAPLLISNNTGPVHLAAAVGTPVVDLYALTNMQHAPWQVPHELLFHDVPCRNCYQSVCPLEHHHCLRLVPPAAVVAAARRLLANSPVGATAMTIRR